MSGHSLRVQLRPAVIGRHGVYQGRVPVRQGVEYRGYIWIRAESFAGGVTVALEADVTGGAIYDEAPLAPVAGEWRQYAFTLRPTASDPLARIAILFTGAGTLWIDQVSLLPGDAVAGVRADVGRAVKDLAPAFIRWPGGNVAQDYRWQWGVGPRDRRPTWINLSWNNEAEPADFGTDEFVQFARSVGAEPSITVNVEGRGATAEEAAAWVESCNGPATSPYGGMRARNGHPEPFAVKYWEIGNEIWGDWVRGHSDAATYARNLTRYLAAMRAADPSIQVIAVGDNDMAWNRTVMRLAEGRIDYLAVHHYYSRRDMDGDLRNLMARPLHYERWYGELDAVLTRGGAGPSAEAGDQRVGSRPAGVAAVLHPWRLVRGPADERVRAAKRHDWHERRLRSRERLAGRHHPGEPPRCLPHADLPGQPAVRDAPGRGAAGGDRRRRRRSRALARAATSPCWTPSRAARPTAAASSSRWSTPTSSGRCRARISVRGARVASRATLERVVAESLAAVNGFRTPDAVRPTRESVSVRRQFLARSAPALGLGPHAHTSRGDGDTRLFRRPRLASSRDGALLLPSRACLRRDGLPRSSSPRARASARWRWPGRRHRPHQPGSTSSSPAAAWWTARARRGCAPTWASPAIASRQSVRSGARTRARSSMPATSSWRPASSTCWASRSSPCSSTAGSPARSTRA